MNIKKMIVLAGLTTAVSGAAVAGGNHHSGWNYDTQDQGWEYGWEDDDLVSIPERGQHVRPREAANYIAKVTAYNKTNQWVKIVAGGQVITWLGPMERRNLTLDANIGQISAIAGERVLRTKRVRSGVREAQPFRIDPPRTGMLKVKNTLRHAVRVFVDGRLVGKIEAMGSERFELDTGSSRIELVAVNGRGQTRSIGSKRITVDAFDNNTLVTPPLRRSNSRRGYSRR